MEWIISKISLISDLILALGGKIQLKTNRKKLKKTILGLFYRFTGGQQKTSSEYLLADGNMSVLPVAFSLMASFMSAITLLGVTQVEIQNLTETLQNVQPSLFDDLA